MTKETTPLNIGGGVIVLNRKGEVLLGVRATQTGFGLWCLPGGKFESDDIDIFHAMRRELMEEAGIYELNKVALISIDDSRVKQNRYMNFCIQGTTDQEPKLSQPNEISEWRWFPIKDLPSEENIFVHSWVSLQSFLLGKIQINNPFNSK